MGCGQYFKKSDVIFIEGVTFCTDCKTAAAEFKATLQSERKSIREHQGIMEAPDDKWEKAWSSEDMISISPERLEKFPHPIPIDGLEPKLWMRIVARVLDYVFVLIWFVAVDSIFHLSRITSWIFGSEQIPPAAFDYPSLLDPKGVRIMLDNPLLLQRTGITLIVLLALYRIPVMLIAKRTLGELFSGVMLTNGVGKYPSAGSRFLRGLAATIGDAALVGPFVDMFFYSITKPSQSISDAISGLYSVRYDSWKNTAKEMLHRRNISHM